MNNLWQTHDEFVKCRELFVYFFPYPTPQLQTWRANADYIEILKFINDFDKKFTYERIFTFLDQNRNYYRILDQFKLAASTKPWDPEETISPYRSRDANRKWYARSKELFYLAYDDFLTICKMSN